MRRWTTFTALMVGSTITLACAGCTPNSNPKSSGGTTTGAQKLSIGGATFIYPMMDKWSFEYQKLKGVKISYNSSGSGTGIQQMIAQTLDFGCTDGPMNDDQLAKAKAQNGEVVHIPLAMGAVVPAYNLPGIEKPLNFTGPILADIYLGKITNWNDPALKEINKDVDLPDKKIAVAHRSDGSGTTYIFADFLSKVSPEWKEKVGVSTSIKFPIGVGNKGNEGVSGFVKETPGSIGYIELIYALSNNITFGAVQNKDGQFILASLQSITVAADAALDDIPDDLRYSITNAMGKDSYPISGTNWAVVYVKQPANKKQTIVDFLTWVTHDGQPLCEKLHYAKLPKGLVDKLEKKIAMIKSAS